MKVLLYFQDIHRCDGLNSFFIRNPFIRNQGLGLSKIKEARGLESWRPKKLPKTGHVKTDKNMGIENINLVDFKY